MFYTLQDGNGGTPLHYAVRAGSVEAVHAIMSRPKVSKILFLLQLSETEMRRSDSARKIKRRVSNSEFARGMDFSKVAKWGKGGSSLFFVSVTEALKERRLYHI